ncbi:MAG: histone deacetylase [Candidatus Lokiarchaeota archaeon]|nr:histone deacetylase [Candidatus Lokiarchaeota archaeon]
MTTGIIYDPIYLEHRIGQHVESHERLIAIMDLLKEKGILDDPNFKLIEPRSATLDQIRYVHSESLINEVKKISEIANSTGHIQNLDMDTSVSARTYEASLFSVGGNLEAVDRILKGDINNAFSIVRPPGHHSRKDKCSGFCIFNNIAITAEYLLREKKIKKLAIIDWDCHHGDGTQDIFYHGSPSEKSEVLFFSSHQDGRTLYPGSGFVNEVGSGKGEGKIINYPLPPKAADDTLMIFFEEIIKPICYDFKPEFILISAGFDTHWTDRLTNMGWTYQAPANFLYKLMTIADDIVKGRIAITLEGGYEIDKQAIAVYNCLRVLNNEKNRIIEEKPRKSDKDLLNYINTKLIPSMKTKLSTYWNCF